MAALKNHRHEEFAQLVANNWPHYKAYEAVYGKQPKQITAHANASRLWGHLKGSEKIRARVHELKMKRRKASEYSYQQLLDILCSPSILHEKQANTLQALLASRC